MYACATNCRRITALAHADAVRDWNQHAATAIISPAPIGAGKPPGTGLVDLAIVHTAIYDAVNAIAGSPFEPYEVTPTVLRHFSQLVLAVLQYAFLLLTSLRH